MSSLVFQRYQQAELRTVSIVISLSLSLLRPLTDDVAC